MPQFDVRSIMYDVGGLLADAVVNHFTFSAAATAAAAIDRVVDFFTGSNSGASPLSTYIGNSRSRALGGWQLQATDISGHVDGKNLPSPALSTMLQLPAGGNSELPDQCAVVVSYHGVLSALPEHGGGVTRPTSEEAQDQGAPAMYTAASRPRASLRGRIYFGPVTHIGIDDLTGDVSTELIAALSVAATRLTTGTDGWAVWSKTYSTITPVTTGWIDKEFGTQRRRKDRTVSRQGW